MPVVARCLCFALVLGAAMAACARGADASPPLAEKTGSLVIVGGAARYSQNDIWNRVVELAGGKGAKIAVFPTASSDPLKNGSRSIDALNRAGADAFLVPLWVSGENEYKKVVADPELVERVRAARGVYFIGGSQERITTALGSSMTERAPLLDAIWDVYRHGGVIAGTSAGAAVMSRMMFRDARSVLGTLEHGVEMGKEVAPGLGFLDARWFVEQHCLARGRFGRSLVAMHTLGIKYGVGVDENSAVVVERGRAMSVIGYKGAIVMDLSQATSDDTVAGFNLKNARLSYLDKGDAFDLDNLQLTPAADKRAEQTIDPNSASFKPSGSSPLVTSDILGNGTLPDLMGKLIESKEPEAIGLAFDAAQARSGPTSGFEFRFYRSGDSLGWYTPASGASAYTVSNIHLDIRPIKIGGPLYSYK